jgi:hypothetical protein
MHLTVISFPDEKKKADENAVQTEDIKKLTNC